MKNCSIIGQYLLVFLFALTLAACSSISRNPLPQSEHLNTRILGKDDLRYWGDGGETPIVKLLQSSDYMERYQGIMHRPHHYLVISGGGENGAYGAGVLAGWSELGTRPEFTVVTGISTGALTAPFAFLGSDYDAQLRKVYTTLNSGSIFRNPGLFRMLGRDGLLDTTPLAKVIENYVDDGMVEALAREYKRGRILAIGTTNLDAARPVVWNLTRIAATGHPQAGRLIRRILLASASLPGVFPPVYFEVQTAGGSTYDEMHVDGGATSQMFFYPADIDWSEIRDKLQIKGDPTLYIIRNSRVEPSYKVVKPRMSAIAGKTVGSLIRTQGIGDYYRIMALADRDGIEVKVTWIPKDALADIEPKESFDPDYMRPLFEYGYQRMLDQKVWLEEGREN